MRVTLLHLTTDARPKEKIFTYLIELVTAHSSRPLPPSLRCRINLVTPYPTLCRHASVAQLRCVVEGRATTQFRPFQNLRTDFPLESRRGVTRSGEEASVSGRIGLGELGTTSTLSVSEWTNEIFLENPHKASNTRGQLDSTREASFVVRDNVCAIPKAQRALSGRTLGGFAPFKSGTQGANRILNALHMNSRPLAFILALMLAA